MDYSTQDGGYAYVIAAASFLGHVLQYGVTWTVGVFYEVFMEMFPENFGKVAFISSLNTAVFYLVGPLSGVLTNRFGARVVCMAGGVIGSVGLITSVYANSVYMLYITYGFITGFGLGLSYIPVVTVLGLYFDKRRSIAIGFAVSGCGAGTFLYPPFIRLFIQTVGWRGAMLLLGGISLNLCVVGALLRPFVHRPSLDITKDVCDMKPKKTQTQMLKEKVKANGYCSVEDLRQLNSNQCSVLNGSVISLENVLASRQSKLNTLGVKDDDVILEYKSQNSGLLNLFIFKNLSYLFLCLNNFCMCFGLSIVYVHLGAYASSTGISSDLSALLFSVIGASNFLGRIVFGLAGHLKNVNHIVLYSSAFLASGLVTLFCPLSQAYAWLVVFAALFGLLTGSFGALLPQCVINIVDLESLAIGYGYLLVFEAGGTVLGAPVAGWLYEYTSLYSTSFYLGGAVIVVSSLVMIYPALSTMDCVHRNKDKTLQTQDTVLTSAESVQCVYREISNHTD